MPQKIVQRGRVKGYRPSLSQLVAIIELAQKGMDEELSSAEITYYQGSREIYPEGPLSTIRQSHLEEIIKEAENPDELNNLELSITQDNPIRRVSIRIGPGQWAIYEVESDDQTWALGRYHELTEMLLSVRNYYTQSRSAAPEVLRDGTDDKWRPAAWELARGWKVVLSGTVPSIMHYMPLVALLGLAVQMADYYYHGHSKADYQSYLQAKQFFHWAAENRSAIFWLTVSYSAGFWSARRWLTSLLTSKISLRKASTFSKFSFRDNNSDPIGLASLYVSVAVMIISVLALLS